MEKYYRKLSIEDEPTTRARFAKDVFLGLMRTKKVLNFKWLYDAIGSEIYEKIMELPEYYLVKSEYNALELAKTNLAEILQDEPFNLIELGSGNAYKTKMLLKHFVENDLDFTYIPIDISEGAIVKLINDLKEELPQIEVSGIVADYFDALEQLRKNDDPERKNFVLFLGSNIGNLTFEESASFVFSLWSALKKDDLVLMGFDLRKNIDMMIQAYNDPQGVTKEFNLNLLRRINRELGGNFDSSKFIHYEPYNVYTGAMESYLISKEDQDVYIEIFDKTFHFEKWEPLFIERSYKYTVSDIENLANISGFKVEKHFFDQQMMFVDSLWCVDRKID